jgi:hypothetical protein
MLKVKQNHPATRCEICHQSDSYNSSLNFCERCKWVTIKNGKVSFDYPIQFIGPILKLFGWQNESWIINFLSRVMVIACFITIALYKYTSTVSLNNDKATIASGAEDFICGWELSPVQTIEGFVTINLIFLIIAAIIGLFGYIEERVFIE